MAKKVLVTGAAGYIGSHVTRMLLDDGYDVVAFDNLSRGHADAVTGCELIQGDLLDPDSLDRLLDVRPVEAVVHFAALSYVAESTSRPDLYYRNNVTGTLNLLDAMRDHEVSRIVFSSTCATYGVPSSLPITEDTPQSPINPYGRSKLMVEHVLEDYATAYGLRSIALRYFNVVGNAPDGLLGERHVPETHLVPLVLLEALRIRSGGRSEDTRLTVYGDDFDTPDGTCIRDYVHVQDLGRAHIAALEHLHSSPAAAMRYNLGVNRGYSVLEIIRCCEEVTGVAIPYKVVPRRPGDPPELVSDATLAMRDLAWRPAHYDVMDGIGDAWRWFCERDA